MLATSAFTPSSPATTRTFVEVWPSCHRCPAAGAPSVQRAAVTRPAGRSHLERRMNPPTDAIGSPPAGGLDALPQLTTTALSPADPSGLQPLGGHVPEQNGAPPVLDGRRPARRDTVSVVIPALNEEPNIAWVLERLPTFVDEVVLVDGHSVDRTVSVARAVRRDVVVVTQNGGGKGAALRAGFAAASGDIIVMI